MSILDYSLSQITSRILLNLPSRFDKTATSNVYYFFEAIANAFQLNTLQIDELFRQTSLTSASGEYVDDYINQLTKIGRYPSGVVYLDTDETDANYIERYKNTVYVYNSTRSGLSQIVIDMNGNAPLNMYTGNKRGAYANARYYFNEGTRSVWGNGANDPFKGYIEFSRRPNSWVLDEMRKLVNKCRGFGIQIFLKYPDGDDLDITSDGGTYELTVLV